MKAMNDETTKLDRTKQYTAAGEIWKWIKSCSQWSDWVALDPKTQWINEDTFLLLNPQLVTEEGA